MNKNILTIGKTQIDIADYASQGNALLGIRDSGKSYTATWIAERLLDAGIPFVAFDPIGIWKYLRVPGKGRGYPVVVAGGENGDLPLTPQSAPEIVRAAMQQGIPLVLDLYDMAMSKADWKTIVEQSVRLLLYENKKHGLRHIFIEEAAEFVPQRIGPDQGRVYAEIEKLARMGGNALLGYTLINQRGEEVNKAVLELCDRLFLHRQKGRNSLIALGKWLDVGSSSETKPIIQSLPLLPQGECWLWDAGSSEPEHVKIPQKNSFHPDRRQTRSASGKQDFKALDVTAFVGQMTADLHQHLEKAKANDPKLLQRRIADLEKQIREHAPAIERVEVPVLSEDEVSGLASLVLALNQLAGSIADSAKSIETAVQKAKAPTALPKPVERPQYTVKSLPAIKVVSETPISGQITVPQQRILDAMAWMESVGLNKARRTVVAFLAGQSPKSSGFTNNLGSLRTNGLIEYPNSDSVSLTSTGRASANHYDRPLSAGEVQDAIVARLPRPQARILEILIGSYPNPVDRALCAERAGQSPTSSGYTNNLGALRSLGVIDYPDARSVRAEPLLFLE